MTARPFTRPAEQRCGVLFGAGVSAQVGNLPFVRDASSILALRSASAVRAGQADALGRGLAGRNVTFMDGTGSHVPAELVASTVELARRKSADVVISLGGGSAIGLGKAVSVEAGTAERGIPHIAVTTTYSGSEQTGRYGVTLSGRKQVRDDPRAFPAMAVYDPELTYSLPAGITAESGVNALAHCVEVLLLDPPDPECRLVAADGLRRIVRALPLCVARPDALEARADMMLGAMQASRAVIMTPTALHHALCHVLGGKTGLAHGALNAVVLPYVVEANAGAAVAGLAALAEALGLPPDTDPASGIGNFLRGFSRSLDLPTSLGEMGIAEDALPELAEIAFAKPQAHRNPARLAGPGDVLTILRRAWAGPVAAAG